MAQCPAAALVGSPAGPLSGAQLLAATTLECGIQLAHLAAPGLGYGVMVAVRTPASDNSGVTHVLEHMVLCGSRRKPDPRLVFRFPERFALSHFNAVTNPALTTYHFTAPGPKALPDATAVLLECVLDPVLDPLDFATEAHRPARLAGGRCGIVLQEVSGMRRLRGRNQRLAMRRALLPATPWRFDDEGAPAQFVRLRHEDVLRCFNTHHGAATSPFAVIALGPPEDTGLGQRMATAVSGTAAGWPVHTRPAGRAPAEQPARPATGTPAGELAVFPSLAGDGIALEAALRVALARTPFADRLVVDADAPGRLVALELGPGRASFDSLGEALALGVKRADCRQRVPAALDEVLTHAVLGHARHPGAIALMSRMAHGLLGDGRPLEPAGEEPSTVARALRALPEGARCIEWQAPAPIPAARPRASTGNRTAVTLSARRQRLPKLAAATASRSLQVGRHRDSPSVHQVLDAGRAPSPPGDERRFRSDAGVPIAVGPCQLTGITRTTLAYDLLAMPSRLRAALAAAPTLAAPDAEVVAVTAPQGLRAVLLVRHAAPAGRRRAGAAELVDACTLATGQRLAALAEDPSGQALAARLDNVAARRADSVVADGHVAVMLAAATSFSASAAAMHRWRHAGSARRLQRLVALARSGRNPFSSHTQWLSSLRPLAALVANASGPAPASSPHTPAPVAVPVLNRVEPGPRLLQGAARRITVPSDVGFRAVALPLAPVAAPDPAALRTASMRLSQRLRENGVAYGAGISVLEEHGAIAAYSYREATAGSSIALRGALTVLMSAPASRLPPPVTDVEQGPAAALLPSHASLERRWLAATLAPGRRERAPVPVPAGIFEAWLSPGDTGR